MDPAVFFTKLKRLETIDKELEDIRNEIPKPLDDNRTLSEKEMERDSIRELIDKSFW